MLISVTDKRVAVIVDIVRSREAADRAAAQVAVESAFERSHASSATASFWPTVGDEFQALYADVPEALRRTLLARLSLPPGLDFRVGIGRGDVVEIAKSPTGSPILDGSAWWSARAAIEEAHRREDSGSGYVRSWFVDAADEPERATTVNSYLLLRDQLISRMSDRSRRLTAGALRGIQQDELARAEGISQSAVSQNLQRSGGSALLAADQLVALR
jgi:hypothetical protein